LALLTGGIASGLWGTPTGQDAKGSAWSTGANGERLLKLNGQVATWPTPQAHDVTKGDAARVGRHGTLHGGRDLTDWVAKWPTPRAADAESTGMSAERLANRAPDNLPSAVKQWPTPAQRDYRFPNNPDGASRSSRPPTSGEQLPNATGGALSPDWVELLMGLPPGWTDIPWQPRRGKATRREP